LTTDTVEPAGMSSLSTPSFPLGGRRRSPLAATLRRRPRELLAAALVGTLLGVVSLRVAGVDVVAAGVAAHASPGLIRPYERPLRRLVVELEVAGAVGLVAAAVATLACAARDHPDVSLRDGRSAFLLAAVAAVVGAGVAHAVGVDLVSGLVASGHVRTEGVGGGYWVAELAVTLPVVAGVACGTPAAVAGAARARLVSRRWRSRDRGLAVLAAISFASVYSPPDSVTFVVAGGLLLAGLSLGMALVEFDLV
jgi:Sec-independent protein secretion pathway component TatC